VVFGVLFGGLPDWIGLLSSEETLKEKEALKGLVVQTFPGFMTAFDKQLSIFENVFERGKPI
jgi:hypothetical protein